jgi:predicted membrane protein
MNTSIARTLTGIGIICIGVAAFLGSFGIIDFSTVAGTYWPVAVIFAALVMYISNPRSFIWPSIVLLAGIGFLARNLGMTDVNVLALVWPAIITYIGLSIVFRRSGFGALKTSARSSDDMTAILGGIESINTSDDYQGGKATAIMGGVTVDLRKAIIKKEAVLDVTSFWGGIEVKVPEGWVVRSRVNVIMGGVEVKTLQIAKKGAPVLTLVGDVIMAGVEVKH